MTQRWLTTDSATLAWSDSGGEGPTLLLIHGWACTQAVWTDTVRHFSPSYRVITLDLAGHGASSSGLRNFALKDFAGDVSAVLHAARASNVFLIGHSMGGAVALEAAALLPDIVQGVVGVDSFTYENIYPKQVESTIAPLVADLSSDFAVGVRNFVCPLFSRDAVPSLVESTLRMMTATPAQVAILAITGLLSWDLDGALERTIVPVATINASVFLEPSAVERYGLRIDIHAMDSVGHFPMLERPTEFNTCLSEVIGYMRADR